MRNLWFLFSLLISKSTVSVWESLVENVRVEIPEAVVPSRDLLKKNCLMRLGTIHILRKQRGWVGGVDEILTFSYMVHSDLFCPTRAGWSFNGYKA